VNFGGNEGVEMATEDTIVKLELALDLLNLLF
jgi:hypothetical protein